MPFIELGKFGFGLSGGQSDPWARAGILMEPNRFLRSRNYEAGVQGWSLNADGSGELAGLVLTADLYSSNWNGGFDLSGGADGTATAGYLLDYDSGSAQFQTVYAEGGELGDLDITGDIEMQAGSSIFAVSGADVIGISPGSYGLYIYGSGTSGQKLHVDSIVEGILVQPSFGAVPQTYGLQIGDNSAINIQILGSGLIYAPDGSSSAPAYAFKGDTDTGVYRAGTNSIGFALAGGSYFRMSGATTKAEFQLDNNGTQFDGVVRITQESSGNSIYGFFNGAWQTYQVLANDNIYWYTGTTRRMSLSTSNLVVGNLATGAPQMPFAAGTVGAPTYAFYGDSDTGIYRIAANYLGIAAGGNLIAQFGYSSPNKEIYLYGVPTTGTLNTLRINTSTGRVHYLTSGRKYKTKITDADLAGADLSPRRFWRTDDEAWQYGFIADEVLAALGEEAITSWDEDGEADNYDDRAVLAWLAAKVKRLEAQLAAA